MDVEETKTTEVKSDIADSSLPAVTASLELLSVDTTSVPSKSRRKLRARLSPVLSNECLNRRCSLRPRKRTYAEVKDGDSEGKKEGNESDTKEYYLNRSLKKNLNRLETIYEEKIDIGESTTYMSSKRYKRMIQFEQKPSDSKLKKRKAKIKKAFGSKINYNRRCASMQMLLDKLNGITTENATKTDSEIK